MSDREDRLKRLSEALNDHSTEGITILSAEPSRLIFGIILAIVALICSALLWSFFGRADVIVSASGQLGPDSEVRRFYAPIEGELIDVFIAEGQPVAAGDVLRTPDVSGYFNTGQLENGLGFAPSNDGVVGKSLLFDGIDDAVREGDRRADDANRVAVDRLLGRRDVRAEVGAHRHLDQLDSEVLRRLEVLRRRDVLRPQLGRGQLGRGQLGQSPHGLQ